MRLARFVPSIFVILAACSAAPKPTAPVADLQAIGPPLMATTMLVREPTQAVLLYFPNRLMDLLDVVRFGVELGPGIGTDLMITDHLRAAAMHRWSSGIGYQTLRRSPFKNSEEKYAEFGPAVHLEELSGDPWHIDPWDVRAELHLAIVGAHVAVNPAEIFDFIVGIATFDPREDDWD